MFPQTCYDDGGQQQYQLLGRNALGSWQPKPKKNKNDHFCNWILRTWHNNICYTEPNGLFSSSDTETRAICSCCSLILVISRTLHNSKLDSFNSKYVTLNSSKLNPLPARTRVLYRKVGHLTMGFNEVVGRGNTRRALATRCACLLCLRAGCIDETIL